MEPVPAVMAGTGFLFPFIVSRSAVIRQQFTHSSDETSHLILATDFPCETPQEWRTLVSLIRIKFHPVGPILTPKGCGQNHINPRRFLDELLNGSSFFLAVMFLFHLNRLHALLLGWALLCGAIWSVQESFANTPGHCSSLCEFSGRRGRRNS